MALTPVRVTELTAATALTPATLAYVVVGGVSQSTTLLALGQFLTADLLDRVAAAEGEVADFDARVAEINSVLGSKQNKTDALDASRLTGTIDLARLPVLPGTAQVVSSGDLAALTAEQQAEITKGAIVTTTDGDRYVYRGTGSKTAESSYILLADIAPDWTTIAGKPTVFPPSAHGHAFGDITGKPATYPPSAHGHAFGDITGKPATYPPEAHSHAVATSTTAGFMSASDKQALDALTGGDEPGDLVTEAPEDGKLYGRKNGDWAEVPTSGGGGTTPAASQPGQNLLDNGDFSIWQRHGPSMTPGTSWNKFGGGTGSGFGPDRWRLTTPGGYATTSSIRRDSNNTGGMENIQNVGPWWLHLTGWTSGTMVLEQSIEDPLSVSKEQLTASIIAVSTGDYTITPRLRFAKADGTFDSATILTGPAIAVPKNTAGVVEHTFTVPTLAISTFPSNDPDVRVLFEWVIAVSGTAGTSTYVRLAAAKLERGAVRSKFVPDHPAVNLQKCKRYFDKSYKQEVAVGTAEFLGALLVEGNNTNLQTFPLQLSGAMRTVPSVRVINPNTGAAGSIHTGGGAKNAATGQVGDSRLQVNVDGSGAFTGIGQFHYQASAEWVHSP